MASRAAVTPRCGLRALNARAVPTLHPFARSKEQSFVAQLRTLLARYNIKTPSVTIEYSGLTVSRRCRARRAPLCGRRLPAPRPEAPRGATALSPCPPCAAQVKTDAAVGSAGIPTVGNMPLRIARRLLGLKQPTVELSVVNGMTGVLRPGRLTLLLGPPGSGKSTFLKVGACMYGRLTTDGLAASRRCMQPSFPVASSSSLRSAARLAVFAPACCAFLHSATGADRIIRTIRTEQATPPLCLLPQVLAGQTKGLQGMRISGSLLYNGHTPDEFQVSAPGPREQGLVSELATLPGDQHAPLHPPGRRSARDARCCPAPLARRCSAPRPLSRSRTATSPPSPSPRRWASPSSARCGGRAQWLLGGVNTACWGPAWQQRAGPA
jgi:hypothetical protein